MLSGLQNFRHQPSHFSPHTSALTLQTSHFRPHPSALRPQTSLGRSKVVRRSKQGASQGDGQSLNNVKEIF